MAVGEGSRATGDGERSTGDGDRGGLEAAREAARSALAAASFALESSSDLSLASISSFFACMASASLVRVSERRGGLGRFVAREPYERFGVGEMYGRAAELTMEATAPRPLRRVGTTGVFGLNIVEEKTPLG